MPQIELVGQGAHAYYVDQGQGPPTVFLHGNPDSAEVFAKVMDSLGECRCLAPDLPGFGRTSTRADYLYTLDHMADFVPDLLSALGVREPVHLVVHDAGGFFGLATVAKHPQLIRRLIVLNTCFFSDYRYHFWARVCRTPLLGELGMAALHPALYRWEMRRGSAAIPESYVQQSYRRITPRMKQQVLRMYRALPPECFSGWEDRLLAATAKIPTLVLWGDRDPYIPQRYAERFGGRVCHYQAGHWLQIEQPSAVADQLRAFLRETP